MRTTLTSPYRPPDPSARVIGFDSCWGWGTETIGGVTGVSPNNWRIIADRRIIPLFEQGLKRMMIWMPFGGGQSNIKTGLLDFYAYTEVVGTDLTKDFVPVMKELQSRAQMMVYCGSLGTRVNLPVNQKESDAWKCVQPLLDAGIKTLLIDGGNEILDGTWEQKFCDQLIAGGITVYCETRPYINLYENGYPVGTLNWVHSRPFISDREFFVNSDGDSNAFHSTGVERILLLHSTPQDQQIAEAKKTLSMVDIKGRGNFTVCAQLYQSCVESKMGLVSDIWK